MTIMRTKAFVWPVVVAVFAVACKKDHSSYLPPSAPAPKILLQDIIEAHLPSPYYHFEYGPDSSVVKVSFDSEFTRYDVFYSGNRISEMRNNIIVNHDTLRYIYDNAGRPAIIKFIDQTGFTYRHAFISYEGGHIDEIYWDRAEGNVGYLIDRELEFDYFPDGNVKEIRERRPAVGNSPETNWKTDYDQYDNKINVDDFALLHDGIHDHLFLLPGIKIQKNNPGKEIRTGDGINYISDFTYTYNKDGAPLTKTGDVLFTAGQQTGQRFQTTVNYTYY